MIVLVPTGGADKTILEALRRPLEEAFGQRTRIGNSIALPRESWREIEQGAAALRLVPAIYGRGERT